VTADAQPRTAATLAYEELRVIAGQTLNLLGGDREWTLAASTVPGELWLVRRGDTHPVFLRASYDHAGCVGVLSEYLKEAGYQRRRHLDAAPVPEAVVSAVLRILDGEGEVR
jgi:hypothetical protein